MFKQHRGRQALLCLLLAIAITGFLVVLPHAETEASLPSDPGTETSVTAEDLSPTNSAVETAGLPTDQAATVSDTASSTPSSDAAAADSTEPTAAPPETDAEEDMTATPLPEETPAKTEYFYEDSEKTVKATLQNPGSVPDDAVLCVETITRDSDPAEYSQLESLVGDMASQGSESPSGFDFCAYNIYFLLWSEKIEPTEGSVTVSITYKEPVFDTATSTDITVYHVVGDGSDASLSTVDTSASVSPSGSLDAVEFKTDSFSVFLVTNGYTMSSSLHYTIIDSSTETFTNTSYYNPRCVLGIAGNFHIVAFGTARLNSHTNGNVLAKNLYASSNFGTNNMVSELSYIQNYLQVSSNSASSSSHVLALGSSAAVALTDNGNAFSINGTKLDSPKNIYQDNSTTSLPFINLISVKSEISSTSSLMASYANAYINSSNLSTGGGSCDESYLSLTSPDSIGVYSISGSALSSYSYIGIKGFSSGHDGSVIINVNCSGLSSVTMPNALVYIDNVAQSTTEVTTFENGKVIWNFINATGVTITARQMTGTIIAIGATVTISSSLNGTVIAENINVNAESHRTDFTGKISDDVTVQKVWKDDCGSVMSGSQLSGLSATVQLCDNGTPLSGSGYTVTLNAANSWSYTWQDLPSTGHSYTVREVSIYNGSATVPVTTSGGVSTASGYLISYDNNAGITAGTVTVTNQKSCDTVDKTVTKVWSDSNNKYGLRPGSITVQLLANGTSYGGTVTLNSTNGWSYTWRGLPKTSGGYTIRYTVKEISAITGYTTCYSSDTFTITNTLDYYGFVIRKVSSECDSETLPGAKFKLEKLTSSSTVDPSFTAITATTGSDGTISFENLPVGTYRLTETAPPPGYSSPNTVYTITISESGITAQGGCRVSPERCSTVTFIIENTPGIVLPGTGGSGTRLSLIAGIALVVTSVVLLGTYITVKKRAIHQKYAHLRFGGNHL